MALVLADRVRESTTTAGTGNITLGGAAVGFQSFSSAMAVGDITYYTIAGQGTNEWEVGIGTLTGASTLVRTTVLDTSNNNTALVNFSAGTKDVFITYPALEAVPKSFLDGTYETLTTTLGVNSYAKGSWAWSPDLSSFGGELYGFTISQDGLKLYSVAGTNDRINQFSLAYPYDVTSATFVGFFDISAQTSTPNSLSINPTGTSVYLGMYNGSPNYIFQYNLSTPWDITTATYAGNLPISASLTDNNQFSNDGLLFFSANIGGINTYSLTTAYDITSGVTFLRSIGIGNLYGFAFSTDGLQLFTQDNTGNLGRRTLSTAWDTDTAGAVTQTAALSDGGRFPQTYGPTRGPMMLNKGVTGVPDGTRLITELIVSGFRIVQFELDSPNSLTNIAEPLYDLSRATSRQINLDAGTYNNYVSRFGTPPYDFGGMTKQVKAATALFVKNNASFINTTSNTNLTLAIGNIFQVTHTGSGAWNMTDVRNAFKTNFNNYGQTTNTGFVVYNPSTQGFNRAVIIAGAPGLTQIGSAEGTNGFIFLYNTAPQFSANNRPNTNSFYTWWQTQNWNRYGESTSSPWTNRGSTQAGTLFYSQLGGGANGTDTPDNFYWDKLRLTNVDANYQGAIAFPRGANDPNNYLRRYYWYGGRWYQREMIYLSENNWGTNARATRAMSELVLNLNWADPVADTFADGESFNYAIPFAGSASQVPTGTNVSGTFLISGTTASPTILSQAVTTTTVVYIHANGLRYRLTYWTADGAVSNVIEGGGYTNSGVITVTFAANTTFYYNYFAEGDITSLTFVKFYFSDTATANWQWIMGEDRGGTQWRIYDASSTRDNQFGGFQQDDTGEGFAFPFPSTRTKRIWTTKSMALPMTTNGVARNYSIQCRFRVDDIYTTTQRILTISNSATATSPINGIAISLNEGTVDRRLNITLGSTTPAAIITNLKAWQYTDNAQWVVVTWVWNPLDTTWPGRLYVNGLMAYKTATNPFGSATVFFNVGSTASGTANGFQGYFQYLTVIPECWGQYFSEGSINGDINAGDPAWLSTTYNAGQNVGFSSRMNYGKAAFLRGSSWRIGANISSANYWDGPLPGGSNDTFTLTCNLTAGSNVVTFANTTAGFSRNPGLFLVTGTGIPTTTNVYAFDTGLTNIVNYGDKNFGMFDVNGAVNATSGGAVSVTFVRVNGGAYNDGILNMPGNALFVAKSNNTALTITREIAGVNASTTTATCAFHDITFVVQAETGIDEYYTTTNTAANNTAASNLLNALAWPKYYQATGAGLSAVSATINPAYIVAVYWDNLGVGRHTIQLDRVRNSTVAAGSTITARFYLGPNQTHSAWEYTGGDSAITTDQTIELYGYSPDVTFASTLGGAKSIMALGGIGQWRFIRPTPPGGVYDSGIFKAATTTFAKKMYLGYSCIGYLITYGTTGDYNQSTVNPVVSTIAWAATNGMNSEGFSLTVVAGTFYRVLILPFNPTLVGDVTSGAL